MISRISVIKSLTLGISNVHFLNGTGDSAEKSLGSLLVNWWLVISGAPLVHTYPPGS